MFTFISIRSRIVDLPYDTSVVSSIERLDSGRVKYAVSCMLAVGVLRCCMLGVT